MATAARQRGGYGGYGSYGGYGGYGGYGAALLYYCLLMFADDAAKINTGDDYESFLTHSRSFCTVTQVRRSVHVAEHKVAMAIISTKRDHTRMLLQLLLLLLLKNTSFTRTR